MPRISRLASNDVPKLKLFLNQRLHEAMFMLSNLRTAGFEDLGGPKNGSYIGAFEGNELVGVACHYRQGNLLLCAPVATEEIVLATIQNTRRHITAIVGPEDQTDAAIKRLGLISHATTCDEREKLYSLSLSELRVPLALELGGQQDVEPGVDLGVDLGVKPGKVRGRVLASKDVDTVTDWTVRYRVEAVGDEDSEQLRAQARDNTRAAVDRGDVWVLEHNDQLLAKTAFNAQIPNAVQVGGVWTPHSLRRRGYGRCVVASHLLDAHHRGQQTAVLFAGDQNLPAHRAYMSLGFQPVGRYRVIIFREAMTVTI